MHSPAVVTGNTSESGNRWIFNASAGRQRFTLAEGFLIANTAGNGGERAALQANARWASDFLALMQFKYNETKIELFQIDPDELPILDTHTKINGINIEDSSLPSLSLAASYLTVPTSDAGYFLPDGSRLSREGLRVTDVRARWQPKPTGLTGPYITAEYARQSNENFPMRATGYYGELGYAFAEKTWSPTFSYRYSRFSGDDPDTPDRFERWDPLLSGGNGEQFVQGVNHFKVVQIGNVAAQRYQLGFGRIPSSSSCLNSGFSKRIRCSTSAATRRFHSWTAPIMVVNSTSRSSISILSISTCTARSP